MTARQDHVEHGTCLCNVGARDLRRTVYCVSVIKHAAHLDRDDGFLVAVVEADPQVFSLPKLILDAIEEVVLLRMDCLQWVQHEGVRLKRWQVLAQLD
jgi:hypothetical protein